MGFSGGKNQTDPLPGTLAKIIEAAEAAADGIKEAHQQQREQVGILQDAIGVCGAAVKTSEMALEKLEMLAADELIGHARAGSFPWSKSIHA